MIIIIESIVACLIFTLIIFLAMYSNPLNMIHDYLLEIQNRAKELGIITNEQKGYNKTDIIRKVFAIIFLGLILAFIVYKFNGDDKFVKGFFIFLSIMECC